MAVIDEIKGVLHKYVHKTGLFKGYYLMEFDFDALAGELDSLVCDVLFEEEAPKH